MKVDNLDSIVEIDCIENMKSRVRICGKEKIWELIERTMNDPKQRIKYRQIYYIALEELKKEE